MNFKIRQSKNIRLVKSLHADIFDADEFPDGDLIFWIAWKGKEPVGFCILTRMEEGLIFLTRAGVMPDHRGNGLQKRFIRVREMYARKHGFSSIITYTKIFNINSSVSLQKSGYMMYQPEWEYADKDCIYWYKNI